MSEIELNEQQFLEFEKVAIGAFAPLDGFMNGEDFHRVVADMRLSNGSPFPLPVIFPISQDVVAAIRGRPSVALVYKNEEVGSLVPEDVYQADLDSAVPHLFGTEDKDHPGVRFFTNTSNWIVGGPATIKPEAVKRFSGDTRTPDEMQDLWRSKGWSRVAGFQTRNVPHRAHEYLIRVALETMDGVLVQPLVGRRKKGDYTPEAIITGYDALIGPFLPKDRVEFSVLSTWMRYAGPREAVFHAIIRRNYGCSHFIVGRDHAGVGNYYGLYDAHELSRRFDGELGIEIMRLHGPYYCSKCECIATERTCSHAVSNPEAVQEISGTLIRAILAENAPVDHNMIRPEIVSAISRINQLFVENE